MWTDAIVSLPVSRTYRLDMLLKLIGYSFRVFCVFLGDEG